MRLAAPATRLLMLLAAAVAAAACTQPPEVRVPATEAYPQRLSEWGLLVRRGDRLVLGEGVEPYEVNTPLFSDYALKLRTYYLPPDSAMSYRPRESFEFPVGSVITKTFFYPTRGEVVQAEQRWDGDVAGLDLTSHRLVETRLLVRRADGWAALPYVWDGDDAHLALTGTVRTLQVAFADDPEGRAHTTLPYVVPARSECAGCHATDHTDGALRLIGVKASQLNRSYAPGQANQLQRWAARGDLQGLPPAGAVPALARQDDPDATLQARARAYLDANCGHCHNPRGAADTSGLLLDHRTDGYRQLGFCKPPIAAGRGTGGRPYSIVPGRPEASILLYRMETTDPATRMPETGRALTHRQGVELIRDWIASLPGECV